MSVKKSQGRQDLLDKIRNNEPATMKSLYHDHREAFVVWSCNRYQCSDDDALEIYQRAFSIMYFNARSGKLTELTSTLKTYLFSIGKNLFREKFRDKHNQVVHLEDHQNHIEQDIDTSIMDAYQNEYQKILVRKLLNEIGDPCRTLLELMFIKGYSTEAVVREMGYSDERVVRKRKSLCLKQLRKMAKEL